MSFEPGGFPGPGWQVTRFSVEMTEPQYLHVFAQPLAWSPATNGRVSGQPMLVEVSSPADFEKYRGKLKGAIVMNGAPRTVPATSFAAAATRYTDTELARGEAAMDPAQALLDNYAGPDYAGAERARRQGLEPRAAMAKFFRDEGVAALLVASPLSSGVITATDAGGFDLSGPDWRIPNPDLAPPSFVLAREHYGRIARLVQRTRPVKLELQLDAEIFESWLKPFATLGATALAVQRVGGTDHLDFDHVGLPAFQFIQDPIDYETRTHHTNMDVLESIQEGDLQQAAAIVATFVYQTAMRDEKLPRVALPKAPPSRSIASPWP